MRVTAGGLQEADGGETGEHRDAKESGWLTLREIGCAIEEIAEAAVADLLGGIFNIVRGGVDAAGGKRHIALEGASRFPNIAGKSLNELGSRPLLLACLAANLVHGPRSEVLGRIPGFLELVLGGVSRCSEGLVGSLLHSRSSFGHLILQVLGRTSVPILIGIRASAQV
ncbi:hypothetical protein [Bradyrhizobium sp.]|uniref:hypothetical protein n=1 Tax=Bradyrhizobium sp. TaxID=376 RepID=UPI0012E8D603|nr:hypothetical protein [Bradyrhizobium sp.]